MQNYRSLALFDGYKTNVYGRNMISDNNAKQTSNTMCEYREWPKKMYTLFTHQYLWNKFK